MFAAGKFVDSIFLLSGGHTLHGACCENLRWMIIGPGMVIGYYQGIDGFHQWKKCHIEDTLFLGEIDEDSSNVQA